MTQQLRSARRTTVSRRHEKRSTARAMTLAEAGIRPRWNPAVDELRLSDAWALSIAKTAKGLRWLIGLFQDAGWPAELAIVAGDPRALKRARNAVTRLDAKLARRRPRLRFCWNGSGNGICCYLVV